MKAVVGASHEDLLECIRNSFIFGEEDCIDDLIARYLQEGDSVTCSLQRWRALFEVLRTMSEEWVLKILTMMSALIPNMVLLEDSDVPSGGWVM